MSDYIVSARKYRPATFSSVVGQTALTATLKNAINTGKLANTYLFCGPRGVGKTTCARIFAKTINCTNRTPDGEACGECESCRSFNSELRSYNVFELDAASNNSVDDIRTLTEQVRIPPMNGKYKVYIIDEVHMLSTSAFNAFLKTLEEPPKYAIFILATTEKHKIIPTILSRCQIYDFGRISNADIMAHLKAVADKEGITTEQEALNIIAEKSDGGMRDALSIFDQVTSFTNGQVTYAKTIENLNVIDYDYYFRLTDMFLEKRISDSLLLLNDILGKGFDGSHLIGGLMLHLRNLLVSRDPVTLPLLEVSDGMRERYKAQAAKCQPRFLYRALKVLNNCDLNYRVSKNKRLLVELALIQTAQADEDDDSSGRKPARLRPIFNKTAARLQSSGSAGNHVQATLSATPAQPRSDGRPGSPSPVQPATGTVPATPSRKQGIPTMKSDKLFNSIYGNSVSSINRKAGTPGQDSKPATAADTALNAPASAKPAKPLTDDLLTFHWQEFAASLPRQDTPLKNRMINCKTTILGPDKFDVFVGNHMVADEINASRERILTHIRESFNNPAIEMTVSVDESRNMEHILTRDEQYARMKEANPSIVELEKVFSLELR
ncbi:MAG: DNA polymerase III subunit gamma/tau [Bacteroidaceae bacterium]|nr:DNA polymerase III subunit gamma/tau [Bacteroidaceae bacterium]